LTRRPVSSLTRMSKINVIPDEDFEVIKIEGKTYIRYSLTEIRGDPMVCTMHRGENWNNLEVLKFAIHCRRLGIRLIMFGALNQFPVFSIFADEVILRSEPNYLEHCYADASDPNHITSMVRIEQPLSLQIADLTIEGWLCNGERTHEVFEQAMDQVSDQDVIDEYSDMEISIFKSSENRFNNMSLPSDMIACELKQHAGSTGWIRKLERRCGELPLIYNRDYFRALCMASGQHYMAVTCLLAMRKNWMWVCYGGSCNIMSFFPFKVLLLSNSLVHKNLSRKLSESRWGINGFPMFDMQQEKFFELSDALVERIKQFSLVNEIHAASSPQLSVA